MKQVVIDGRNIKDKEDFHDKMKAYFALDDHYGRNLDALWDMLTEKDRLRITIIHSGMLLNNLGEYGEHILDLFEDLSHEDMNYQVRIF